MPDQPAALAKFKAQYGRLCVLTAKALAQKHNPAKVAKAAQGKGWDVAPVYVILRGQRAQVASSLQICHYNGTSLAEIGDVCRAIRTVVEQEWMLELPRFAEPA